MALELWRMQRAQAAETAALAGLADPDETDPAARLMDLLAADLAGPQIMFRISRYDSQAFRGYVRARQELQAMQADRAAAALQPEPAQPEPAPSRPQRAAPSSPAPSDLPTVLQFSAENGFVPSNPPASRPALLSSVSPAALLARDAPLEGSWSGDLARWTG